MTEFLLTKGFMPHGFCMQWRPELLWLHVWSDIGIAAAYFSIPLMLIYFVKKRAAIADIPSNYMLIAFMFAAFILFCGMTHVMGLITIWKPLYGAQGLIKAATAFISIATAVAMVPLLPKALALRSPEQVEKFQAELQHELSALKSENQALRRRVAELQDSSTADPH